MKKVLWGIIGAAVIVSGCIGGTALAEQVWIQSPPPVLADQVWIESPPAVTPAPVIAEQVWITSTQKV